MDIFPRNWGFGLVLSKFRNFAEERGLSTPQPTPPPHPLHTERHCRRRFSSGIITACPKHYIALCDMKIEAEMSIEISLWF
jgi:hypothetical protein